jgi:hypothetical protein
MNQDNPFLELQNIRPTKNISNLILMYNDSPTSECLSKQFSFLKEKKFIDDKGVTFLGKTTFVAGKLGISFLSTLMLADFILQHTRKSTHDTSCHISTSEIRAKLSPIASKNRLKMLTSELQKKNYIKKNNDVFFLNHDVISKITSVPFFDGLIDYFSHEN